MNRIFCLLLLLASSFASAQFQGPYNFCKWNLTSGNGPGTVDTSSMPNSLTLTGPDNGSGNSGDAFYTVTIPTNTIIKFDWHYTTADIPLNEIPHVVVNGHQTLLNGFDPLGSKNQSGSMNVSVNVNAEFAFHIYSENNILGAASITISNFTTEDGSNSLAAPTAADQTLCVSATVANLVATGTDLKWYDVATNGNALSTSTALATGTYYVSQTECSSESTRAAVAVTVTPQPAAPTVACYETATWNSDTCQYDITGTQPANPNLVNIDVTYSGN